MKLAVGFFDGVHLGHRRILAGADAALTFTNHPLSIIAPDRAPPLIMSLDERISAILGALGTGNGERGRVRAMDFTPQIQNMEPRAFIEMLKREYPDLDVIRCGPNWRFGAKGEGDADYARGMGLSVEEVPFVVYKGAAVSSTRIRQALAVGDVVEASNMLGRSWSMSGEVFSGKGEGHRLGFPTLNMRPFEKALPLLRGVYVVETEWGRAVANWGIAPTMGDDAWKESVLEVHLLDVSKTLPAPREMSVSFSRFLRPEMKFASQEDLVRQMAEDCKEAARGDV